MPAGNIFPSAITLTKRLPVCSPSGTKTQTKAGVKYPKMSKHVQKLYKKKNDCISDYLHKVTRFIAEYCHDNDINTVVIGDITNIRKDNNKGSVTNQKLHSLPYRKLYILLEYKLAMYGIRFVKQNESLFQPDQSAYVGGL